VAAPAKILKQALQLKPAQKAELVDELLSSLDQTDKEIRTQWAREAESRINAYERGKLKAVSIEKVLNKYK
jgi:putative addiction module component (TIGR02574 family)